MSDPEVDENAASAHAEADAMDDQCPTPTAHARLREAHKHWHDALSEYQRPEGFRIALNACIQTLRNVTFALQKEKRLVPEFDDWYSDWQSKMKQDFIMRWVVAARNQIVKAQDLETHSWAIVRFTTDYYTAAAEVERSLTSADRASEPEKGSGTPDANGTSETSPEPPAEMLLWRSSL